MWLARSGWHLARRCRQLLEQLNPQAAFRPTRLEPHLLVLAHCLGIHRPRVVPARRQRDTESTTEDSRTDVLPLGRQLASGAPPVLRRGSNGGEPASRSLVCTASDERSVKSEQWQCWAGGCRFGSLASDRSFRGLISRKNAGDPGVLSLPESGFAPWLALIALNMVASGGRRGAVAARVREVATSRDGVKGRCEGAAYLVF